MKNLYSLFSEVERKHQECHKLLQTVVGKLDKEEFLDQQLQKVLMASESKSEHSVDLQNEYRNRTQVIFNHLKTALDVNKKIEEMIYDNNDFKLILIIDSSKSKLATYCNNDS
eukprot:554125_1